MLDYTGWLSWSLGPPSDWMTLLNHLKRDRWVPRVVEHDGSKKLQQQGGGLSSWRGCGSTWDLPFAWFGRRVFEPGVAETKPGAHAIHLRVASGCSCFLTVSEGSISLDCNSWSSLTTQFWLNTVRKYKCFLLQSHWILKVCNQSSLVWDFFLNMTYLQSWSSCTSFCCSSPQIRLEQLCACWRKMVFDV